MLSLHDARRIVRERWTAALGDVPEDEQLIYYTANADGERAVLSGYDIDHDELLEMLNESSVFYANVAYTEGLEVAFRAAFSDALLIGLVKGADSRA